MAEPPGERVESVGPAGRVESVAPAERLQSDPTAGSDVDLSRFGLDSSGDEWLARVRRVERAAELGRIGGYELLEVVGEGGQGVVYRAREAHTGRTVALKRLLSGSYAGPAARARFQREIQADVSLRHPNIVTTYGVEVVDGQPLLSMEWVDGLTLDRWLGQERLRRTTGDLLRVFLKICDGMQHAHQRGVIHRDLKPSNILVDASGEPRVLDFGLAKLVRPDRSGAPALTASDAFVGTLAFASPEQVRGEPGGTDVRSDVYALGVVLYQALTGRPPFAERRDMQALSHAICHEEPPPPTSIDRQLDRDIDAIVARAMAKAPERRYQSVDALAADVRRHLAGEPIEARRDSAWYLLRKNLWRYRVPVGVGVAVTTLLAVAAGVAWTLYLRAEEFGSATAAAETRAREQLRESLLAQARMSRQTRNMGRRFDALKALGKAARISPSAELRDEALAALARFDVRVAWQWDNPGDRPPATFDPDLKTVAIGHQDGSFVLLRAADRAEVGRLEGNGLPVGWFSFSPDGETFAARLAQDTQVRIWNVRDGRVLHDLQSGGVAFSLDSSRCAYVSNDGSMHLLELSTGREAATFDPPPELTFGGFHPAGDRIALFSRSGGDITIIDLATRATVGTLPNTERLTFGLWSDDGELFAAGGVNGHVYTWNALTGQRLAEGLKHQGDVGFMWFNHAGTLLVSYGLESWTRFWDPHTGEALLAIPGVVPRVFSRDDRFLGYRSRAGDIGVWEIAHDDVFSRIHGDFDQTGGDLTRDGRYMFVSGSRAVRVCDLAEHREVARLPIGPTCNVRLHPDGTRLFTSGDIGIHEWPLGFGDDAVTIGPPNTLFADSGCNGMSLSADGRLLAAVVQSDGVDGSEPSEAIVLDTREPRGPRRFGPHERMNHAVLSSDGRWLATATWKGRGVKVWDVDSGQLAAEFPATPTVSANRTEEDTAHLKFSPDGRWLLVITIAACAFHEVGTWERVWSIPTGVVSDTPANAAFRADGAVLAFTPTPHTVQLFDVEARRPLATLSPPDPTFIHAGYPLYSTSPNR